MNIQQQAKKLAQTLHREYMHERRLGPTTTYELINIMERIERGELVEVVEYTCAGCPSEEKFTHEYPCHSCKDNPKYQHYGRRMSND